MPAPDENLEPRPSERGEGRDLFLTTHWSVVLQAGQDDLSKAEAALETLCRTYWYPLYAFVRRHGHAPHDAQDLTQSFFERLLERRDLRLADQTRGRFRSFLLSSLKHFLVNEWARGQARKRGGGQPLLSLNEAAAEQIFQQEPATQTPPESLYDKRWAITLLERAMDRLEADYARSGRGELFTRLRPWLLAEVTGDTYRELAGPLRMNEGALKVALHRLRQRFRDTVRDEVAQTVSSPEEVDEELRCLMASLNS